MGRCSSRVSEWENEELFASPLGWQWGKRKRKIGGYSTVSTGRAEKQFGDPCSDQNGLGVTSYLAELGSNCGEAFSN